ncbi:GNAT family N-acetyltransferase [Pleurocapsales cyanobacterium LEGE 06147]|nr:GNAT family N-acetyltransferase [Pleurocapsales cyanobacterium LEGE 06147]
MTEKQNPIVREATEREDSLIARHFYQLWLDNNVSTDLIRANWLDETLHFIEKARRELGFQAFVAESDGKVVGSASCQLFAGLYPQVFEYQHRKYGYIWNVYVESSYRRQRIATKLTNKTIDHLKSLGCTRAILHASPFGRPVYERLGFIAGNEMQLELK